MSCRPPSSDSRTRSELTALFAALLLLAGCIAPVSETAPLDCRCDAPVSAGSKSFAARVVKVKDGDTLDVEPACLPPGAILVTVRLGGVDAPETPKRGRDGQPGGEEAWRFLESLVSSGTVIVEPRQRDRYQRTVGRVTTDDGRDVEIEMVRSGWAWWYRQYAGDDRALEEAEAAAKADRLGIWHEDGPEPPWEFRRAQKSGE
ncbi:MAG: thermonuclease family protein [Deltaproteobacteria bacterium]|nr:thermonuclease family protein [Deltaproteobacteria bacterium]